MKRLLAFLLAACLPLVAEAQEHKHTKTCLSRCRPAPQYVERPQYVAPPIDLDKLESTTERIADEQRYGTHVGYMQLSELQQIKLLLAMAGTKEAAKDAATAELARDGAFAGTVIPDPRTLTPTPLPDVRTQPGTVIPDPRTLEPTPLPDVRQQPGTMVPDPRQLTPTPLPGSPPPYPTKKTQHRAWPNVKR